MMRLIMFFEGFGQAWSETYFSTRATTHSDLQTLSKALTGPRTNLLALGYKLAVCRTSDDLVDGDSLPWDPYPPPDHVLQASGAGGATQGAGMDFSIEDTYNPKLIKYPSAHPNIGLKLWTDNAYYHRKTRTIAGVPLPVVHSPYNPNFDLCPDFLNPWNAFKAALGNGDWAIKALDKSPTDLPPTPIKSITSDVEGVISVTLANPPPKSPGKVLITRPKCASGSQRINGAHLVEWVTGSNTFKLLDQFGSIDYLHGGSVRAYSYVLLPINHVEDRGIGTKKRGVRGYSPPAGRSSRQGTIVK